jgi:RecA-family ATPase
MEVEQIKTDQVKTEANLREMRSSKELLKEQMLAKIEISQERMEANQEKLDAKTDANQEKMQARIDGNNEMFEVLLSTHLPNGHPQSQYRGHIRRNNR